MPAILAELAGVRQQARRRDRLATALETLLVLGGAAGELQRAACRPTQN